MNDFDTVAFGAAWRTRPKKVCPHCQQPGGICAEHRARLRQIAEEMNSGKRKWSRKTIAGTRGEHEDDSTGGEMLPSDASLD